MSGEVRVRRLLLVWLASALVVTLAPFGPLRPPAPLEFPGDSRVGLFDVFANIALFVPFGALTVLAGRKRSTAMLFGLLLTFGVESAQRFLEPRCPSWLDVAANAAGAALGACFAGTLRDTVLRLDRAPLRLLALVAGATGALALLAGWPGAARFTVLLPFVFAVLGATLATGLWRPPVASLLTLAAVAGACALFWGPPAPVVAATTLGGAALGGWPHDRLRPARRPVPTSRPRP